LRELKALKQPDMLTIGQRNVALSQKKWKPLPSMIAKVNVDAAISKTENQGAAALCQDNTGQYPGSSIPVFNCITALACSEALALAS
jgi:hypothetical protein